MRILQVLTALGILGCQKPAPVRIEVVREWTVEGGEAFFYVHVDRNDLERAGVSETEVREFLLQCAHAVGEALTSAVVEMFGSGTETTAPPKRDPPPWVRQVFRDGIDFEIVEVDRDGNRTVTRHRRPGWK